jgi:hypothetical protein
MPIALSSLGHAGQAGYVFNEGDAVSVEPADNLPQGGYFVTNDSTGQSIHVESDELADYVGGFDCPAGWDCIEGDDDSEPADLDDYADESEEIDYDDWVTDDGCKFRHSGTGRIVLDATDMTDARAERAAGRIMRKEGFFPNIWYVSDHGNVSVFTF